MIPAPRKPADVEMDPTGDAQPNRTATVNLGDTASAWPTDITVSVTIVQGRPTYHAVATKRKGSSR